MDLINARSIEPIDYLIIGHLTHDFNGAESRIGGTAAYAGLMARALGLRPGIVSSFAPDLDLEALDGIPILFQPSEYSTTFKNIYDAGKRRQSLTHVAESLTLSHIPATWLSAPIIHVGPVAGEVDPMLVRQLPEGFVGVTPQGWFRQRNDAGTVSFKDWPEAAFILERANAVVLSNEDVNWKHELVDDLSSAVRVLALTEAHEGVRIYWHGDIKGFRAEQAPLPDATGAGDVFAACFFWRLMTTKDPWEAARFATKLASTFVSRPGFSGIPTQSEISAALIEVIRSY